MIPVNETVISKNAQRYVTDCIKTGWISSFGKYIERFEQLFAQYLDVKYAVTTTSGTTAIHLALAALGIGTGDEVIVPDLTIISCAVAVIYTGARPVFVDVDPITGTIDHEKIEEKITSKTKAIMPVHLYSYSAEMDSIRKIAKKHGLFIIEDAAEALGTTYKGKKVGSLSDVGCFSFYGNKLITTGEGGMVVTNNKIIYEKMQILKNLAHSPQRRFVHNELGFNYRMTNLQAALGVAQLEEIEMYIAKKQWIYKQYHQGLNNNLFLKLPAIVRGMRYAGWMFTILLLKNAPINKQALLAKLKLLGIDTREYFIPMHQQPILNKLRLIGRQDKYPISDRLSDQGFYIPSGLSLTKKQITTVVNGINKSLSI